MHSTSYTPCRVRPYRSDLSNSELGAPPLSRLISATNLGYRSGAMHRLPAMPHDISTVDSAVVLVGTPTAALASSDADEAAAGAELSPFSPWPMPIPRAGMGGRGGPTPKALTRVGKRKLEKVQLNTMVMHRKVPNLKKN